MNCVGRGAGSAFGGWFLAHGAFLGKTGGRALYTLAALGAPLMIAPL